MKTIIESQSNQASCGQKILAFSAVLLAIMVIFPLPPLDHDHPGRWLNRLVGIGEMLLVLYFAFRGGSICLRIIRVMLLIFGAILALLLAASIAGAIRDIPEPDAPSLKELFEWNFLRLLLGYAFFFWVFFLSSSVRAYIKQRQACS